MAEKRTSEAAGWYRMQRGWMDHEIFPAEPYTEREAWLWLIENAAWKATRVRVGARVVKLARGQLAYSTRYMAGKWQWSEARVRRFLKRLKIDAMIDATTDAGVTQVTICNYAKHQSGRPERDAPSDAPSDAEATQERRTADANKKKEEEGEEGEESSSAAGAAADLRVIDGGKQPAAKAYAFEGVTFRLNQADYDRWRKRFRNIADFDATLQTADDYYRENPPPDGKCFFRVSRWLEKANAEAAQERRRAAYGDDWW